MPLAWVFLRVRFVGGCAWMFVVFLIIIEVTILGNITLAKTEFATLLVKTLGG